MAGPVVDCPVMAAHTIDRARVRREAGATVRLALPLIVAQLSAMAPNAIDAILAGHFSAHVQAAVVTGTSIWVLALVLALGTMMSVSPTVSQLDGAQRRGEIGAIFHQALWIAWFLGAALWFGSRNATPLMTAFGVVPSLHDDVQAFLHAISWAAPALTTYFALRGLSEGLSMPMPSMYFSIGGLFVLAPLGYVLVYGKLGFPPMGARGTGIATAVAIWVEMIGFGIYVLTHRAYRDINLRQRLDWPRWSKIAPLLHIGVPMAITLLMEAGMFVAVALLIGRLGETVAASHQIALNVASMSFMVPLGLSMAITVRVGNAVGRNDPAGVRYAGFCGIGLVVAVQLVAVALMLGVPHGIAAIYSNNPAVIAMAAHLLLFAGMFQFSDGIQVASNSSLRGLKDTRVPMAITLVAYWVIGMPIGWYLGFPMGLGAPGMWIGLIAGLTAAAALLFGRFYRVARRASWTSAT
jgi:MATE family multidrug resistance protein